MSTKGNAIEHGCEIVYEEIMGKKIGHLEVGGEYIQCPPLATSLDAWRPIWDVMSKRQLADLAENLFHVCNPERLPEFATPLHHLEAALRMLGHNELAEEVRECEK